MYIHINKCKMLGKTGIAKATGENLPNLIKLQSPLEGPDSIAYSFCTGCGNTLELTQLGVNRIAEVLDQQFPDDFSGFYFKTASCSCCDGADKTVSIEKIAHAG